MKKNIFPEDIQVPDIVKQKAEDAFLQIRMEKQETNTQRKTKRTMWKVAAASLALVLVLPAGAAGAQKIYQHFHAEVHRDMYQVDMKLGDTKASGTAVSEEHARRYVKLTADFGGDYKKEKETDQAMVSCDYKGGFSSGKSFWYELLYMDEKETDIENYDVADSRNLTIGGRKAVYCRYNEVVGSRYSKEYKVNYNQGIYIFLEDSGYVIRLAAQGGLPEDDFIQLAEKIRVTAADRETASDSILYSKRNKCGWEIKAYKDQTGEVIERKNINTNGSANVSGAVFKVKSVQILDGVDSLKKDAFDPAGDYFAYDQIVGKNGKLKTYNRESVSTGDGVKTAERSVKKTEKIQPRLVYVTAEIRHASSIRKNIYQVPSLQLTTKSGDQIIKNPNSYNRPAYILDAYTDQMPCYFEESMGGRSGWFAKIKGDKMTLHFAYLVDADMTDGMALCLNDWASSKDEPIYVDISGK